MDTLSSTEEPGAGKTGLARIVVLAGSFQGGRLEVGIGKDDQWPLPPEFGREGDDVSPRGHPDVARRLRRAGERDPSDTAIGYQGGTDLLTDALDDVEHSGWEPRFGRQIGQE